MLTIFNLLNISLLKHQRFNTTKSTLEINQFSFAQNNCGTSDPIDSKWDNTPLYTKFDPGFSKNQFL